MYFNRTFQDMFVKTFFKCFLILFIISIIFKPDNVCKSDCKKLKYSKPCIIACEQYESENRFSIDTKRNKEIIPSNLWYGLTNKYRDILDENKGLYLSLNNDYFVKYMKVNSLYIKNSPWSKYYSNEFKKILNNLDEYEWFLPAVMPLNMFPVYIKFVDYISITITENNNGNFSVDNYTTVDLHNQSKYYFYLDTSQNRISIKFFGKRRD